MQNTSAFNVVFVGGAVVGELLTAKDEALLFGIDAGFLLDSLLDSPDGVGGIDVNLGLIAREELDLDEHGWGEERERRAEGADDVCSGRKRGVPKGTCNLRFVDTGVSGKVYRGTRQKGIWRACAGGMRVCSEV